MKKITLFLSLLMTCTLYLSAYAQTTVTFNPTGSTQTFVVPAGVNSITVEAQGAQGGLSGGLGASITGTFAVSSGETLNLIVGEQGGSRTNNAGVGGGGGGSFIWNTSGPTLLIAAGGGGGGAGNGNAAAGPGSATNAPTDSTNGSGNAAGGTGGNGGAGGALVSSATCEAGGGGGTGWLSNGADGASPNAPLSGGGVNPLAGGAGGNQGPNCGFTPTGSAVGGFGGGGGGGGVSGAGGGGGGYNGGGGGNSWPGGNPPGWGAGGGGGSFNGGTMPSNIAGVRAGNGQINITYMISDLPPTAVCTNYTAILDAMGNVTISAANVDGGSSDPEGPVTLSVSPSSFTCANLGANTVTLTVTDSMGQTDTCTATVTVDDTTPPTPDVIPLPDVIAQCEVTSLTSPTATDNCGGPLTVTNNATLPITMQGTTVVTWAYDDGNGNIAFQNQNVIIDDTTPPSITCPANISVNNDPGVCGAVVMYAAPVGTDNCSGATTVQIAGLPSGATFPVGTTTNTFEVTDSGGNTASCSFDVTVIDNEDPTITCPADITVSNDPGICGAVVSYADPTAADNCSTPVQQSITTTFAGGNGQNGNMFDITAINDITIDSFDMNINAGTGTAEIYYKSGSYVGFETNAGAWTLAGSTVVTSAGNGAPTPLNLNLGINVSAGQSVGLYVTMTAGSGVAYTNGANTYTDANIQITTGVGKVYPFGGTFSPRTWNGNVVYSSGGAPMVMQTAGLPSGSTFPVGTTTNTFVVTDAAGNTATCSFDVTVNDTEDPVITCPANIAVNNDPGLCSAVVTYSVTGSDNCPGETISQTAGLPSGSAFPVGTTTNTFVVTDASGNTATCSFDVTVTDNEPPVAICQDITVQLDANGMASIVPSQIDNGSTDNCGIASLAVSPSSFDCSDVGPNTVTLTVTDVNGNSSTCTATVTVEDNVPPVAMCVADFTLPLDATGNASITVMDIDNGSTDACGIASISISPSSFTCADVGPNTVTLTVTDVNGNVSTCTTVVTVEDVTPPAIACPADVNTTTDPGVCGATVFFADAIAVDECGIMSVVQTMGLPSGSVFPVGTTTIEYTATDVNGNTNTCTFDITVVDDEPAMAVCMDITIQLDATGNASITPMDVDGGSTDNCGIASMTVTPSAFTCADVGDNPVVLEITDDNGNVSSCTAIVTVEDVTPPVAVCQNITVELDVNGMVTVDPALVNAGSTDACGIASLSLDIDTFDCSNVGDNNVVLTVTDVNGNTSTCMAVITVEDNIAPDLVCMDITLELDENGEAVITPGDVILSNTDACGIDTTAVDIFEFDCDDIGTPITVTVFSIDVNGNISSCTAVVTVVDALAPVVTCPADQTVDPGPGNLFYTVPDYFATGEATAVDNCTDPLTITSQDPAPGTQLSDGLYTVTICATDESGNEGCCTFELTVESILGGNDPADFGTITLYPNPATDKIYLSNPKQIELDQVAIYDMTGRLVKTFNLEGMGSEKALDISELATATYMFIINNDNGQMTRSIIKE